jgi:SulP family sulfate permease
MPLSFLLAPALREACKGYSFPTFRRDLLAAFVVSLIALPLSMALSVAVGLPPQHGLYTAVVAGAVVPLLGGSAWQVSGPTAAFVVILAPIVSEFGLRGIIWAGLMAGVLLVAAGAAGLGRLIRYVPYPVTTGFTAGIAVVIATLSLNDFLGLGVAALGETYIDKAAAILSRLPSFDPYAAAVGATTLALLFAGKRLVPFLPAAITAVAAGTLLALLFNHLGHDVATVASKFSYVATDGTRVPGVPPYPPRLHWPSLAPGELLSLPSLVEFKTLLGPALAIAILAALESLLSATVADSMGGTRHHPDAELAAIGVGNVLSALAAGIPATGAIARTAANIKAGAKTPLASSLHAVFVMLYVAALAPYIGHIPMAGLAALLLHTAYHMSHYKQFLRALCVAPRSDVAVLLACFLLTVFVDMAVGVGAGMILAAFLLMRQTAELAGVEIEGPPSSPSDAPRRLPEGTLVCRIRGPLFFGAVEKIFGRYHFAHDYVDNVILDLSAVPFIDLTGLVALKSMLASVAREGRAVHIVAGTDATDRIRRKIAGEEFASFVRFYAALPDAEAALRG